MPLLPMPAFRPIRTRADLPPHATQYLPTGAQLVRSAPFELLLAASPEVLSRRRLVLVDGRAGCGKTTALAALAAAASIPVARATITPPATGVKVLEAIHTSLTGHPAGLSQRRYENMLRDTLGREPRLLLIDEAQNAGLPVLRTLRLMLEATNAQFALVLAGYGIAAHIQQEEMLRSWVGLTVTFDALDPTGDLLPTLRDLHPQLAATPDPLLLEVNRVHCRGRLRDWVVVLETALSFAPQGPFTRAVFADAIHTIAGTRPALVA